MIIESAATADASSLAIAAMAISLAVAYLVCKIASPRSRKSNKPGRRDSDKNK